MGFGEQGGSFWSFWDPCWSHRLFLLSFKMSLCDLEAFEIVMKLKALKRLLSGDEDLAEGREEVEIVLLAFIIEVQPKIVDEDKGEAACRFLKELESGELERCADDPLLSCTEKGFCWLAMGVDEEIIAMGAEESLPELHLFRALLMPLFEKVFFC